MLKDLDALLDVVRSQQPGCFPDRRRPESPSDPIAHRGVEGDPDERRVHALHVRDVGEAHEGPDPGESRRPRRVAGPVGFRPSSLTALTPRPASSTLSPGSISGWRRPASYSTRPSPGRVAWSE